MKGHMNPDPGVRFDQYLEEERSRPSTFGPEADKRRLDLIRDRLPEAMQLYGAIRTVAALAQTEGENTPPFVRSLQEKELATLRRFVPGATVADASYLANRVDLAALCVYNVERPIPRESSKVVRRLRCPERSGVIRPTVITYVTGHPGLTARGIAEGLGLPRDVVQSCLGRLKNEGVVVRDDTFPAHWWTTGDDAPAVKRYIRPEVNAFVYAHRGMTFRTAELASRLGTTPSAVSPTLGALQNKGVIERCPEGWRVVEKIVAG